MFKIRKTIFEVEEGKSLSPKFDKKGLIPVITTDYKNGNVLMHGYMNKLALKKTIETNLQTTDGRTQRFFDKIKIIENDQIITEKIPSGKGDEIYFEYYLNLKNNSVIKSKKP